MSKNIHELLDKAWAAYSVGCPFMSDETFDKLAAEYGYEKINEAFEKKADHMHRMYSLQKKFDEEPEPSTMCGNVVSSPKLDGAAISIRYEDGHLVQAITRGNGITGEDITDKIYFITPHAVDTPFAVQIDGEVVAPKTIENARNFSSGALHLKDLNEFKTQRANKLVFVAYAIRPYLFNKSYSDDMIMLEKWGFHTILSNDIEKLFPTDGEVYRLDDNELYLKQGYTEKHPRGAYARKRSSDVEIKETVLRKVDWQVGRTGKVTPVANFDEIIIDDAKINKATLHNVGFIEEMNLEIGDTILVTRSGGIIPKVLGKK